MAPRQTAKNVEKTHQQLITEDQAKHDQAQRDHQAATDKAWRDHNAQTNQPETDNGKITLANGTTVGAGGALTNDKGKGKNS